MSAEVDQMPPTQYLVLDVLAARTRLGEALWTFPTRLGPALEALERLGLVEYKSGIVEHTYMAWLTDDGRSSVLAENYVTPAGRVAAEIADAIEADRDGPGPNGVRLKHSPEQWWKHGMSNAAQIARSFEGTR